MTPALGILCYHRIVASSEVETSWPYLERGTAIREDTFRAQLAEVEHFADVLGEGEALEVLAGRRTLVRPAVWLTFDDGYVDAKRACAEVRTGTVFISTSTSQRLLPADAWYAALLRASRTQGALDLGLGSFEYDLSHRGGRARLVDGPERRSYLRAPAVMQEAMLSRLVARLGAGEESKAALDIYLSAEDLRELLRRGWSIGSHGVTHAPFDSISREEIVWEATSSRQVLLALGGRVRSLALPDGAHSLHEGALCSAGYECVLGLGGVPAGPRAVVASRFLVPDDPAWALRVLQPALMRGQMEEARG